MVGWDDKEAGIKDFSHICGLETKFLMVPFDEIGDIVMWC
jgi:hypothetical protein